MQYKLKKSFIKKLRKTYYDYEVANILEFHKSSISNFFSSRVPPSKKFIVSVCLKFNVKPTDFLK